MADVHAARAAVLDAAEDRRSDGSSSWHLTANGANRLGISIVVLPGGLRAPALGWSVLTPGSPEWQQLGLPAPQTVVAEVPKWASELLMWSRRERIAGERLPGPLDIPVWVEPATGRVVAVEVDQVAAELEPLRADGVRIWKQDSAPLAPVRTALSLPRTLLRFGASMVKEWREAIGDFRADTGRPAFPRPDGAAHPPIEGVDYRTWTTIRALIVRDEVHPMHLEAFTAFRGVAPGRWAAVDAAWAARAAADPALGAWAAADFLHMKSTGAQWMEP